jgi:hypothetical protein
MLLLPLLVRCARCSRPTGWFMTIPPVISHHAIVAHDPQVRPGGGVVVVVVVVVVGGQHKTLATF